MTVADEHGPRLASMPALAQAALSPAERRMLDRFVAAAEERLGGDLLSVWIVLYGSP